MFSFLSLTIKCGRGLVRAFFWDYLEYSDKESNKIAKKCQMNKCKETLVSIFERRISTRILFEVSKDERISSFLSFRQYVSSLRLLQTFAGVLGEKIRMRVILKENTANYISLESLINVDFGKI